MSTLNIQADEVLLNVQTKLVRNIIFNGLVGTMLFWWPWAAVPFEVPKVVFFEWFVKVLTLFFAYNFFSGQNDWKVDPKIFYVVCLFVIWSIFTSFVGANVSKSFLGNYYRNDGLITLFHLVGFSLLIIYFWIKDLKKTFSLAFFLSSITLSLVAISEITLHKFDLGTAATFGNPNFLAGFLAVCLPFGYYLFRTEKQKIYLIGSLLTALTIILIGAVSSILTLILFAGILVMLEVKVKWKYLLICLLVWSASVVVFVWARDYFNKNSESFIAEGRIRIYRNVLLGISKKPFFGYGWANTDKAFESAIWPIKFNNDVYVDKAHSEFLDIAAGTGIPGLVIYFILIILVFVKLIKKLKTSEDKNWEITLISILILYLFHSQTNIISVTEQLIFWIVLGVILV